MNEEKTLSTCLKDQLRLVSVSKGQDLKYVLLRLQKAVARIEEALKVSGFLLQFYPFSFYSLQLKFLEVILLKSYSK